MTQHEQPINTVNLNDDTVNIRQELEKYAYYWKWFVLSVFLALVVAYAYLRYTPKTYEVSTTILINDENGASFASELSAFEDLGLMGGSQTSLENEIELLKSRTLLAQVVKELELNVKYYAAGRVKTSEVYAKNSPVKFTFFTKDSLFYESDTMFSIKITGANEFVLSDINENKISTGVFGENIKTNFGDITVTPLNANKIGVNEELTVRIVPVQSVVSGYRNSIQIQPINKNASVIKISLVDQLKVKAADVLNKLVTIYNEEVVEDKSIVSKKTDKFINDRLAIITKDLETVESDVEEFKTTNNITNINSEASLVLDANAEIEKRIVDLNTQLKLANYVDDYLKGNEGDLIPANLGLSNESISSNTQKYNELLLERDRILQSSSKLNPVIINLENQIKGLRSNISQSLSNFKSSLEISLNDVKRQDYILNSKISSVPKQEKEFREIQRQQQIIESLYLYLLKKREENAISLASTIPNSKIIDKAYGSKVPVAPKKNIILLAALLIGLIVPFAFIYIKFLLDNKVHGKKDIEAMFSAPILGDIPKTTHTKKVVVSDTDRSGIAEAFRLLRTNINFMFSKGVKESKIIFLSSTISGEGKTFIAINTASVLGLSSKKVLLIGADIRNPKIIDYLEMENSKGLTHFLRNEELSPKDVVNRIEAYGFDMIHSGIIPPNPAELLMNGRFEEVINWGKENYDYIIVDTAPVSLVTDTLLISSYADLFIYVIRANYLDKRLLEVPKTMYNENRLPNMAVLINDTDYERGYGYGYGYGYGNDGAAKKSNKGLFNKIKKKIK
ncbi:polysaccharide biosynthesis tyrosine autokinase [Lutibacter sp. TH_r2]|uniref:GumC family protein n=1 Tax=Lutibacter sp. TH_r2 TaxID=3082083 RepID=UPI002953E590|nr:polysaccharide biosynthesis tyrosine autokinase [Lutibacter sp. TH_r2]MDV7187780.1 polysaccharide biosynthesis tyrosine autokinase [Lutibacter sp. TH_r2]